MGHFGIRHLRALSGVLIHRFLSSNVLRFLRVFSGFRRLLGLRNPWKLFCPITDVVALKIDFGKIMVTSLAMREKVRPMRMKGKRKGRLHCGIGGIGGEVVTMRLVFSVFVVFHELSDEQHPKYGWQVGWRWCESGGLYGCAWWSQYGREGPGEEECPGSMLSDVKAKHPSHGTSEILVQ